MRTRELQAAMADISRQLPGQYSALEAHLADAPVEVQVEFARLIHAFTDLGHRARRDGRKDVWMRGKF